MPLRPCNARPHGFRHQKRLNDSQAWGGLGGGSPMSEARAVFLPSRNSSRIGRRISNDEASGTEMPGVADTHRTARGQSLPQSGTAGWPSGQQAMPLAIDAIVCAVMAGAADEAPTGPSTSPKRASARTRRLANDQGCIGPEHVTASRGWLPAHGNVIGKSVLSGSKSPQLTASNVRSPEVEGHLGDDVLFRSWMPAFDFQPLPSKAFRNVTSSTKCGRPPFSRSLRASMILVPWWLWSQSRDATAAMTR